MCDPTFRPNPAALLSERLRLATITSQPLQSLSSLNPSRIPDRPPWRRSRCCERSQIIWREPSDFPKIRTRAGTRPRGSFLASAVLSRRTGVHISSAFPLRGMVPPYCSRMAGRPVLKYAPSIAGRAAMGHPLTRAGSAGVRGRRQAHPTLLRSRPGQARAVV